MKAIALSLIGGLIGLSSCTAPPADSTPAAAQTIVPVEPQQLSLWQAVALFLIEKGDPNDRFQSEFIDLNRDGTEDALVLLGPPHWCGTGGCTLLVFEGVGNDFIVRSQTSLVQTPFTISDSLTEGWRDLIVNVAGGGATPMTVVLPFDGQDYPANPSVLVPLPPDSAIAGDAVFAGLVDFRAIGDTAGLETACQGAITAELGPPTNLEFARNDEGGSAYGYTLADGSAGTCRVTYDGIVEYVQ